MKFLMAGLILVALYLILINWGAANLILSSTFNGVQGIYTTLQGR